jgi:hypothetical protein
MKNYVKIENSPDLVKDTNSGAVLNTNVQALEAYRKRREKNSKVDNLEDEINTIKQTVNELKSLMVAILSERK